MGFDAVPGFSDQNDWFPEPVLFGTGYNVDMRLSHRSLRSFSKRGRVSTAARRRYIQEHGLLQQNPWSLEVCKSISLEDWKSNEHVQRVFRSVEGYSIPRIFALKRTVPEEGEKFESLERELAELKAM